MTLAVTMEIDAGDFESASDRLLGALDRNVRLGLQMAQRTVVDRARRTTLFQDRTGALRGSILAAPIAGSFSGGQLRGRVTVGTARVKYASYVHDGTAPHVIVPRRRKALAFAGSQPGLVFAKRVNHPGTAPRPFLTQAAEESEAEINESMQQLVEAAVLEAGFDT